MNKFSFWVVFFLFKETRSCLLCLQQLEPTDDIVLVVLIEDKNSHIFLQQLQTKLNEVHSLYNESFYRNKKRSYLFFTSCNYSSAVEILLEIYIGERFRSFFLFNSCVTLATSLNEDTSKLISAAATINTNIYHIDFNSENKISYEGNSIPYINSPLPYAFIDFVVQDVNVKNLILVKITKAAENRFNSSTRNDESGMFSLTATKYSDLCITAYSVEYNNFSYIANIAEELSADNKLGNLFIHADIGTTLGVKKFLEELQRSNTHIGKIFVHSKELYLNLKQWSKYYCSRKRITKVSVVHYGELLSNYTSLQTLVYFIAFRQLTTTHDIYFYDSIKNKLENEKIYVNLLRAQCDTADNIYFVRFTEKQIIRYRKDKGNLCSQINCPSGSEQKIQLGFVSQEKFAQGKTCVSCPNNFFKSNHGENECTKCFSNFVSNINRTACEDPFKIDCLNLKDTKGRLIIAYSAISFSYSGFIILTFFHKRYSAVVKTGNFLLSTSQLTCHGLITIAIPFLYLGRPSNVTCSSRPAVIGFLFTFVASVTFVKTRKYIKVFSSTHRFSNKEKMLMNSKDAMIGLFFLVIQCFLWGGSFLKSSPFVSESINYAKMTRTFRCSTGSLITVQVVYVGCVLLLCATQCFRARNLPSYFNETTEITYSTCISCILLICYLPIYYGNGETNAQTAAVCFLMLTVNLVIMVTMFTPKIYVIYFRPQDNSNHKVLLKLKEFSKDDF